MQKSRKTDRGAVDRPLGDNDNLNVVDRFCGSLSHAQLHPFLQTSPAHTFTHTQTHRHNIIVNHQFYCDTRIYEKGFRSLIHRIEP